MSDVKINPNIRPIQPTKEQEAPRRSERTGDSNFDDVMAQVQQATKSADQVTAKTGKVTDGASAQEAMQQAEAGMRDLMRAKGLLELAARMQTGKTDPSNKS